nr:odorant binding protein 15 [Trissolcus basalis]
MFHSSKKNKTTFKMRRIVFLLFALAAVSTATRLVRRESDFDNSEDLHRHHRHHHHHHHHHHDDDGHEESSGRQGRLDHKPPRPHFLMTDEMRKAYKECEAGAGEDNRLGCLVSCTMQKLREMSETGKLNEKKIVEDIYAKAALEEKLARSCIAEIHAGEKMDPCDVADAYLGCIIKKSFMPHKNQQKDEDASNEEY